MLRAELRVQTACTVSLSERQAMKSARISACIVLAAVVVGAAFAIWLLGSPLHQEGRMPALQWRELPIIATLVVGLVGFCLMLTAFVLAAVSGVAHTRLLFVGAGLGVLFSVLFLLPGMVPWWDYSSAWQVWIQGVFVGFTLGILYWRWLGARFMQRRGG
jgi:hypothetical protein